MKKKLALLLAVLMFSSSLASCSNSVQNADTDDKQSAEVQSADISEDTGEEKEFSREDEPDNLPERDFGGNTFTVLGAEESSCGFDKYVYTEEYNGEAVNDAVYNRNLAVQDRYNVIIGYYPCDTYSNANTVITNCVTAGDYSFQLCQYHVVSSGGVAVKGYYNDWYTIPYVDFSRSWWSDSTVEDLTVNGRCFMAMGDFALSGISRTYVMLYDKEELDNYQLNDFYSIVKEGKWTLDYVKDVIAKVYTDANGNGVEDVGDYFGLATDIYSNLNTYLWATDNHVILKDPDGVPYVAYYSEHLVDSYNKCYEMLNSGGVYQEGAHGAGTKLFSQYGTLLCNAVLDSVIDVLAEFDHEYGVIPYPKFDETQNSYKTMVDGCHEIMSVAKNVPESEFEYIGIMTEVLCAESYKKVVPQFFDVCLKSRYASSPHDAEMMDLCVASRVFDLGYVYDNWNGCSFIFQTLLADATHPDITSYYSKKKKPVEKYYDKIFKLFEE